jgi:hypothetical protein
VKTIAIVILFCLVSTARADIYKVTPSRGELAEGSRIPCDDTVKTQLRAFVRSLVAIATNRDGMILRFTDYEQSTDSYFGSEPKYGYFKLGNKKTALLIVITNDSVLDINLVSHEDGKTCYEKWEGAVSR